jgi:hypothetical protein
MYPGKARASAAGVLGGLQGATLISAHSVHVTKPCHGEMQDVNEADALHVYKGVRYS